MNEEEHRRSLLARRTRLIQEIESLTVQLRACDAMLGGYVYAEPPLAVPAALLADSAPAPAAPATGSPAAAPAGKAGQPALTEAERAELTTRAESQQRGYISARVELAIAECGDTFTMHDVTKILCARYGLEASYVKEQVGSSLWKLAHKRGYRVVKPGAGTRPTVYGR